ncbi:MAG: molybdopterin-dependent oxidoreductase, partial [Candidatus Caldatribacteriaceae bacterium]
MKRIWIPLTVLCAVLIVPGTAIPGERVKLSPDTPKSQILNMNPAEVDPSLLPLDALSALNTTGTPPENLDIKTWRLEVKGKGVENPL